MHLLLAGLVQTAIQLEAAGEEAKRLQLACWALKGALKAAKDVYAAERLTLPALPPLEDPQFRVRSPATGCPMSNLLDVIVDKQTSLKA